MSDEIQYVDPHTEGTFSYGGQDYYFSALYGFPLKILRGTMFFPTDATSLQPLVFSSGQTVPVASSAHLRGKDIVLFDIPGVTDNTGIQYYAFWDLTKLQPTELDNTQQATDAHDRQLQIDIVTDVEVSKMDAFSKLLWSLTPKSMEQFFLQIRKVAPYIIGGIGLLVLSRFVPKGRRVRR